MSSMMVLLAKAILRFAVSEATRVDLRCTKHNSYKNVFKVESITTLLEGNVLYLLRVFRTFFFDLVSSKSGVSGTMTDIFSRKRLHKFLENLTVRFVLISRAEKIKVHQG